jgi:hypothetical protein
VRQQKQVVKAACDAGVGLVDGGHHSTPLHQCNVY